MNSVERVKSICKERKIPISKLEKDLGFANGYISQLRKGVFPADRLKMIAGYLNVDSDFLLTGEEKAPTGDGERKFRDDEIMFALSRGGEDEITDAMFQEVRNFAEFIAQREAMKKKKGDN